jgi:hypothetical protein
MMTDFFFNVAGAAVTIAFVHFVWEGTGALVYYVNSQIEGDIVTREQALQKKLFEVIDDNRRLTTVITEQVEEQAEMAQELRDAERALDNTRAETELWQSQYNDKSKHDKLDALFTKGLCVIGPVIRHLFPSIPWPQAEGEDRPATTTAGATMNFGDFIRMVRNATMVGADIHTETEVAAETETEVAAETETELAAETETEVAVETETEVTGETETEVTDETESEKIENPTVEQENDEAIESKTDYGEGLMRTIAGTNNTRQ